MLSMSTFLFTLLGLTVGSSYPCAMRREIAPCTCRLQEPKLTTIVVACEEMPSFANIIDVLQNRFSPEQDISLKISFSKLQDMTGRSFKELGMSVSNLNLNFDDLSYLPESSFVGLEEVEYLSLADNRLLEIPRTVLRKMPKLKTLDLGRSRISNLLNEDFEDLRTLRHLLLPANLLSRIESKALPKTMRRIHLGKNYLRDLNGSFRALTDLEWIFINGNQLTTLQDQLPPEAPKLILLHAAHNQLTHLPVELRNYPVMDSLFFMNNDIVSLDGVLQKLRRLKRLHLTHNKIHTLADDEFAETEIMDDVQMGHNHLKQLNKAFLPMRKLRSLNLTHNYLQEFSFQEIRGLQNLKIVDLSHNKISRLSGRMENLVELETRVEELRLEHNEIRALEGALMGVHGLQRLYLSHNKLMNIAPDDLIGLEDLRVLDISHNHLKTLDETSKTFLPRLEELVANNNWLTTLDKDFHGLPVLCKADLSNNQISTIGPDLISKTRCKVSGVYGVLRVYLHDNPVLCNPDFNTTADYMEGNFTLLQGDFSICPPIPPTTTTTTTTTSTTTTTTTTEASIEKQNVVDIPTFIRIRQPEVIPLLFTPELYKETAPNETQPEEPTTESTTSSTTTSTTSTTTTTTTTAEPPPPAPHEILKTQISNNGENLMIMNSPVVLKDEGNLTLVIPMENGVIKKDHVIDQYIQKNDNINLLNQTKISSAITNIEIVEIKQLPNDSLLASPNNEEEKKIMSN